MSKGRNKSFTGRASSRAVIEHHSKSFALASKLLPPACREDAYVLYAWCRHADDVVDEQGVASSQRARLAGLRAELDEVYAGTAPGRPLAQAFAEVVHRSRIPRAYPDELLMGMQMDLDGVAYPDEQTLLLYCYRVAGVVGLMMCHVLGVRHPQAVVHAAHLGIAMQLTNIARDVQEDWGRGRLYLPDDWLAEAGAEHLRSALGGPLPREARGAIAAVTQRMLRRADQYYRSGDAGLRYLSLRSGLGVRTARLVYWAIGNHVRGQGCDPFAGRAHVPTKEKLRLVGEALVAAAASAPSMLMAAPVGVPGTWIDDPAKVIALPT